MLVEKNHRPAAASISNQPAGARAGATEDLRLVERARSPGPRRCRARGALDGGDGPSFDYETTAPYRDSVFAGAGVSAKIGDRWNASVFYNVNFGAEGFTNNIISTSLGFSF